MTRIESLVPESLGNRMPTRIAVRRVNWVEVARTDIADAGRCWMLWVVAGVFAVLMVLAAMYPALFFPSPGLEMPFRWGVRLVSYVLRWLVPLTALLVGSVAVVGEREPGRLRMLLGLPITRRDVVAGKLLGRSVIFGVILLSGLTASGMAVWYFSVDFDFGAYVLFAAMTLVYGSTFVSIGVGVSALLRSRIRAIGASVGVFALVGALWRTIPNGVFYIVEGQYPGTVARPWNPPAWFVFLGNLNPANAYFAIFAEGARDVFPSDGQVGTAEYREYVVEGVEPFYLQPELLLVGLALWGLVPLVVGTWRFVRSDLR